MKVFLKFLNFSNNMYPLEWISCPKYIEHFKNPNHLILWNVRAITFFVICAFKFVDANKQDTNNLVR